MKQTILMLSLLIVGLTSAAVSDNSVTPEKRKYTVSSEIPKVSRKSDLNAPITLWAKDANISEVLKVLSEKSGMNFVAGEGVHREKITIILDKTPLDEAINLLVRAAGLSYEIIGNSVLIAEPGKLKEEVGQSGYVIELKYARADEVADMLKDITENIKVDKGGNRLICFTSPRVINEIEQIIEEIDKPNLLVLLDTRIIELSVDDLDKYGINWGEFSPVSGGIKAVESPLTQALGAGSWVKKTLEMDVSLDMLLQEGDAQILMNSKLTTTNNREASLHIGEIIPYTIQSYNVGGDGGGANYEIQKEEVGVMISMLPHINQENQITLSLQPEISSIVGWKGPNNDVPLVRVRKTETTIRVEDGQTLFIAGLLAEERSEELQKVPILGDIPLIGLLFQHKKEVVTKKNLIIEVTPRIIRDPDQLKVWESLKKEVLGEFGEREEKVSKRDQRKKDKKESETVRVENELVAEPVTDTKTTK
jgi:type II secretory pathway component GspD/PulD (secretin)